SGSSRGVWTLVVTNLDLRKFDPKEVLKTVRESEKARAAKPSDPSFLPSEVVEEEVELVWHQQLHKVLMDLSPAAFERLAQRLLRESGFIQVEVTGKSGDGGIDGIG